MSVARGEDQIGQQVTPPSFMVRGGQVIAGVAAKP
jgi:hypothetical protein